MCKCGASGTVLYWVGDSPDGKRKGLHIRQDCASCGDYIQFAQQTPQNIVAADRYEPKQRSLF